MGTTLTKRKFKLEFLDELHVVTQGLCCCIRNRDIFVTSASFVFGIHTCMLSSRFS